MKTLDVLAMWMNVQLLFLLLEFQYLIKYNFEDTANLKSFIGKCNEEFHVEILINNAAFYQFEATPNDLEINTIEKYLKINQK